MTAKGLLDAAKADDRLALNIQYLTLRYSSIHSGTQTHPSFTGGGDEICYADLPSIDTSSPDHIRKRGCRVCSLSA